MSPLRCATLFYNRGHRRGLGGFGETFYPHDEYRFRTKVATWGTNTLHEKKKVWVQGDCQFDSMLKEVDDC